MFKPRLIYQTLRQHLEKKEYTIITGARQTGKTTILRELYREQKGKGLKVYYISFENIEILREANQNPENLFRFVRRPINPLDSDLKEDEKIFIFIDEIQHLNDPSGFLKYLYDTYLENLKVIATSSSAFYMDQKFRDSLAGRKKIFHLEPLTLIECFGFLDRPDLISELDNIRKDQHYRSLKNNEIFEYFDNYLVYGGYPAICLEKNRQWKEDLLFEIRNSYVKKDIFEAGVRNEMDFYKLMSVLASQTGNLMNRNELSKTLRMHISTIDHYLYILQKSFHLHLVKPFYGNLRKELTKMPKVYFSDLGIRNAMVNRFTELRNRDDKGALLENYSFIRLKEMNKTENLYYWRTTEGNEVDFIQSNEPKQGRAFEIKFHAKKISAVKYRKFRENYPEIKFEIYSYSDSDDGISILKL